MVFKCIGSTLSGLTIPTQTLGGWSVIVHMSDQSNDAYEAHDYISKFEGKFVSVIVLGMNGNPVLKHMETLVQKAELIIYLDHQMWRDMYLSQLQRFLLVLSTTDIGKLITELRLYPTLKFVEISDRDTEGFSSVQLPHEKVCTIYLSNNPDINLYLLPLVLYSTSDILRPVIKSYDPPPYESLLPPPTAPLSMETIISIPPPDTRERVGRTVQLLCHPKSLQFVLAVIFLLLLALIIWSSD